MISLIVAYDQGYGIGKNNDLLYHFAKDLKQFRTITSGTAMVMGKNTWDSLPRKLPKRQHIVLSRTPQTNADFNVTSLAEILALHDTLGDLMVIGGASVYEMLLPHTDRMHVTYINDTTKADVSVSFLKSHMHEFDLSKISHDQDINTLTDKDTLLSFLTYDRIKAATK